MNNFTGPPGGMSAATQAPAPMLVSRHFTLPEFACHGGEPYPDVWIDERLTPLCSVLDQIRDAWGGPLTVVSGYRTAAFNGALIQASQFRNGGLSGVAQNSQHVQGRAADIRPDNPTEMRNAQLWDLIKALYADGHGRINMLGGLGIYTGWVHVDIRPRLNGHLAMWTGAGVGSEK